ncbi:hypothetical protein AZZ62_002716, partial [Klebsiella variicola]
APVAGSQPAGRSATGASAV